MSEDRTFVFICMGWLGLMLINTTVLSDNRVNYHQNGTKQRCVSLITTGWYRYLEDVCWFEEEQTNLLSEELWILTWAKTTVFNSQQVNFHHTRLQLRERTTVWMRMNDSTIWGVISTHLDQHLSFQLWAGPFSSNWTQMTLRLISAHLLTPMPKKPTQIEVRTCGLAM